jgi:hypothetical protein
VFLDVGKPILGESLLMARERLVHLRLLFQRSVNRILPALDRM